MKRINLKSITNSLSSKEMKAVTGAGWPDLPDSLACVVAECDDGFTFYEFGCLAAADFCLLHHHGIMRLCTTQITGCS